MKRAMARPNLLTSGVAPNFGSGRGLKPFSIANVSARYCVAPNFGSGRGLKQAFGGSAAAQGLVAPNFGSGRGLKPLESAAETHWPTSRPELRFGARIETLALLPKRRKRNVAPNVGSGRGLKHD